MPDSPIMPGDRVVALDHTLFRDDVSTPPSHTFRPATVLVRYGRKAYYPVSEVTRVYPDLCDLKFGHRPDDVSRGHFTDGLRLEPSNDQETEDDPAMTRRRKMSVPLKVHDQGSSPFDKIRRFRPDGSEYWIARELMPYLGYVEWRKMAGAVERAQMSCATQGYDPADHFVGAAKMVGIGSGAARNVDDWEMTRLGCYLTAMNGDVRKPEIAAAQGYFAMMTRAQEIAKQQARPPAVAIDPILAMCTAIATMRQEQIDMRQAQLAGEAESTS